VSVYVFVGPTLRREEVSAELDAFCLPPVAQGDVYRAALKRPRAIGIVDGYFGGAPSVWHKEILWALSQGIHVFGSASIGALRAAELHSFGMRGVGRIFEMFRDGVLEDDDEVAVVHGPAEIGFAAMSEPMVNIRATLAQAEATGIVSPSSRYKIENLAKSLFFPDRTWPAVIERADSNGLSKAETRVLQGWLPRGRVDQKREDALEMLSAIREALIRPDPHEPDFRFEWTYFWDELVAQPGGGSGLDDPHSPPLIRAVLDELRLEGHDAYKMVQTAALLRLFTGLEAKRRGLKPPTQAIRETLTRFRSEFGLFNRAELDAWLVRNQLDVACLERLMEDLTHSEEAARRWGPSLELELVDEVRLRGAYERFAQRARQKEKALAKASVGLIAAGPANPNTIALRQWYFEQRLGRSIPDKVDAYARELGFAELGDFDCALRREWIYLYLAR